MMTVLKRWVMTTLAAATVVIAGAGGAGNPDDGDYQASRDLIENMTPSQKKELIDKQERFLKLPEAEQEKLRQLHRALEKEENREELEEVMEAYFEWVLKLSASERSELNSVSSPKERIKQVMRFKASSDWRKRRHRGPGSFPWSSWGGRSPEKMEAFNERYDLLKSWAGRFVTSHSRQLADCLPEGERQSWETSLKKAQAEEGDKDTALWRVLARWYLAAGPKVELPLEESDLEDLKSRMSSEKENPFSGMPRDRHVQLTNGFLRGLISWQLRWQYPDLNGLLTRDEVAAFARANPRVRENLPDDEGMAGHFLRARYVDAKLGADRHRGDGRPRGLGFPEGGPGRDGPRGPGRGPRGDFRPPFGDPPKRPDRLDMPGPPRGERPDEP